MQYLTPLSVPIHTHPAPVFTRPAPGWTLISRLILCLAVCALVAFAWKHPDTTMVQIIILTSIGVAAFAFRTEFMSADVNDLKQHQKLLRLEVERLQKQRRDAEVMRIRAGKFASIAEAGASMAHDIKNPIASISSAIQQIAEIPGIADTEKMLVELAQKESERLARIVTQYLDNASEDFETSEAFNVVEVTRNAVNLASAHPARAASVQIACDYPVSGILVKGNEDLIHRAVFNLILNAVQASPPNTTVRVEVAPVNRWKDRQFEHGAVAISVRDQGKGIPPGDREKIFSPFYTSREDGTGIGLTVVSKAMQEHRGFIDIDFTHVSETDNRGYGASFTLLVPRS